MKLLVIENDNYCQDNFEEFIRSLVDLKDINEVVYCYDSKNKPQKVVEYLREGADYITLCPHVIQSRQWEYLISWIARYKVKNLKEIHIYYLLDDFEKDLMKVIDYSFVDKIFEMKEKGIGLFLSKLHFLDKIFCLKRVNVQRLRDRSITIM
jgi:hypothetical protein